MNDLSRHFAGCRAVHFAECRAVGGGRALSRKALSTLLMAAAAVSGCGSGSSPTAAVNQPAATTPPPTTAPPSTDTDTVLSLYESAWLQASLTASALEYGTMNYQVRTTGACVFGSGSMGATLDGGPVIAGLLPAESHTFEVTFRDCLVDGLASISLNGTASAVYTSVDLTDVTAMVSTSSIRGTGLALRSSLWDVASEGSGTWRRLTNSGFTTTTYTPAVGSTLVNNLTGNSATFLGGSYSSGQTPPPPGSSASVQQDFANLTVSINGTEYILDGTLQSVYGFVGNQGRHTGEVRITSNGALVARVYGDANSMFSIEVLTGLVPF
jgi:hypothetical protein